MSELFFAKSKQTNGSQPTVEQHLDAVANLAEKFALEFGKAEAGKAAGLLHDFGKYSRIFQLVLEGKAEGVDHAVGGAFYVINRTRPELRLLGRRKNVVEAINGHHDGLLDYNTILRWFAAFASGEECIRTNNRKQCVFDLDSYKKAETLFRNNFPNYKLPTEIKTERDELKSMLDTRMLFSCLVDADYSTSAQEANEDYFVANRLAPFEPEQWLARLNDFRNKIRTSSDSNPELNIIRDSLYEQCGMMGEGQETGLFTLTAPTGTGKTLSLLHFALRHCLRHQKRRIILVLPFLTLLEQNARVYQQIIPNLLEDHSQKELPFEAMEFAATWNAPVILTTSVKFFESLFAQKPTDCRKLHNIANSIIVFDEAQSLPPQLTSSTLQAVNSLCEKFNCSIVFSTATQPEFNAISSLSWHPTEIVPNHKWMYQALKRVKVAWNILRETTLDTIAEEMSGLDSVCTIVNLRKHARKLFRHLKARCSEDSIFFLCTDLCTQHRSEVVDVIKERTKQGLPCRVVATQCIEAGVDLDFRDVYRALAPLESIIQAAGRCNRNGKFEGDGRVTVFVPGEDGRRYPDNWYESAANIVRRLNHEKELDINCTEDIKRYYTALFYNQKDKESLTDAINRRDYISVNKEYRLIERQGQQVIVPYAGQEELFQAVRQEVLAGGISRQAMRQSAGITISVYEKDEILEQYAERLYYPKKGSAGATFSNYYLLRPQYYRLYTPDMGFQMEASQDYDIFI